MKNEFRKRQLAPFLILLMADTLILLPIIPEIKLACIVLLLFCLPGWSLLEAFFPSPTNFPERIVLAMGISYAISVLGMLYLTYLPGTVSQGQLLIAATAWVLLFQTIAVAWRNRYRALEIDGREMWLLLAIAGLALALRLPLMGYSEFHEDEIEVANFAVDVLGGEDYALFLHRKGPVQSLLPIMLWLNTNKITEFISRFPFFLASVLGVVAVYLLAKRWVGLPAAVIAALLLVVNGASVGFGRLLQYQMIILFLGTLAIWAFWYADYNKNYAWAVVGSLLLGVCTLAHFDSFMYFPIVAWQIWLVVKNAHQKGRAFKWLAVGGVLYALIVAGFYVPYILDPQFTHTLSYLADDRIGNDFLYNNLAKLHQFSATYNSIYYLPLLFGASIIPLARWANTLTLKIGLIFCIGLVFSTFRYPYFWKINSVNLAIAPWLALLIWGWVGLKTENRNVQLVWIWWLTSFVGYVFFVDNPGTHFYVAYPAWMILAGVGLWQLWWALAARWPRWGGRIISGSIAAAMSILFLYQTILFWHTDVDYHNRYVKTWSENPLRYLYPNLPESYGYFGSPKRLGWKVAGALIDSDVLPGDYRSMNEMFSVPIWYTYQTSRSCYNDPQNYLVVDSETPASPLLQNYTLVGNVMVEGTTRIRLYSKGKTEQSVVDYDYAEYASQFDSRATINHFLQLPSLQNPGNWYFGEAIKLLGFELSRTNLSPGEMLEVTLRWEALEPQDIRYRAFVHLEKEQMWGQHDDDPACRLPTTAWRAGQISEGQFRVMIDPATPAGEYPLTVGIYNPDDWQRLPVFDVNRNPVGDQLLLTIVNVTPQTQ